MAWATIESFLKDFGLTETETEVYIFIAKHGVLNNRQIALQMDKDRAQILRILKRLQSKGLVESTLEVPQRFTALPFEKVLEAFVKEKREEANLIENKKRELLDYWKKIGKSNLEPSLVKFSVIKGNRKIYLKIAQMIKEATNQLSFISTVIDLKRAIQHGLFDLDTNTSPKIAIQLRFITEVTDRNAGIMKSLLRLALKAGVEIKGRNPDLGSRLFPRMVIKDKDEIIFFIKPKMAKKDESADLCLWTNCTELVQAFTSVFEDLWSTSTDIQLKIREAETGISLAPKTYIINESTAARKKHEEIMKAAEKEIIMITSPKGLKDIAEKTTLVEDWVQRGVSIRIMAPITSENKDTAEQLSKSAEVRHVPFDYLGTTIVDSKHLFQFKNPVQDQERPELKKHFDNVFFTTDPDYVTKTKNMLNEIWKNSTLPSTTTLSTIINRPAPMISSSEKKQKDSAYDKLILDLKEKPEVITEKYVLNKVLNAKMYPAKNWPNNVLISYGSTGHAVIHPPESFNLPDIMIWIMHLNKQSSFGAEDLLVAYLWLETQNGQSYVPVVALTDNLSTIPFREKQFSGTPARNNILAVKKEEFQVRVHGNTFFAGWTVPIPLFPDDLVLPPSCLLLEGYSKLRSGLTKFRYPSGIKVISEHNGFDAFVTYFHPASKYSGPGTDGRIHRDIVTTFYPP